MHHFGIIMRFSEYDNKFLLAQRLSGFAGIMNWCPCPWNVGVEVSDELLW